MIALTGLLLSVSCLAVCDYVGVAFAIYVAQTCEQVVVVTAVTSGVKIA